MSLDALAKEYSAARTALAEVRDQLREAVLSEIDAGMSEQEAAKRAGVSRLTVRAWRGKG